MPSEWAIRTVRNAKAKMFQKAGADAVTFWAEIVDIAYFTGANNAVQRIEMETNKIRREIARMEVPDGK